MWTLVSSSHCQAQWLDDPQYEPHVRRGIDHIYNLSFDSAQAEFQQLVKAKPDHPAGYFFLAAVEWWNILITLDDNSRSDRDEKFLSLLDRVIDLCDKRLDKNENDLPALFFKGGALGFRGRLHGNREDWLKAASDGRTALPIVRDTYKLAPNNEDILLGMGIYNYYAAVIPEKYPFVKPFMIFFPRGDKQKGIQQLRRASQNASYANIEASYFLMQILHFFEQQQVEALELALNLYKKYPNNVVFHKYVGRCHAALGHWEEADTTFREIVQRVKEQRVGYSTTVEREAHYYLGLYQMTVKNYDAALEYLYHCDELSRVLDRNGPSAFMTMCNLKIGMIYDTQKKRDDAITQYNKVLKMADFQDAHRQAELYLKKPYGTF